MVERRPAMLGAGKAATLAAVIMAAAIGCGAAANQQARGTMALTIGSSAFEHMASIPPRYTCDGADVSPPLNWQGVDDGAKSLVLIVDDPDAPDPAAPKLTWVHWVVYNLPPELGGLPEGGARALPAAAKNGRNDWRRTGYGGPCPPVGRHRYFFKLYALDVVLANLGEPTKAELESAMRGHIVQQAELIGTYRRHGR